MKGKPFRWRPQHRWTVTSAPEEAEEGLTHACLWGDWNWVCPAILAGDSCTTLSWFTLEKICLCLLPRSHNAISKKNQVHRIVNSVQALQSWKVFFLRH